MSMATAFSDLVFPRWCAGCGTWDETLCELCLAELFPPRWHDVAAGAPYLTTVRTRAAGLALPGDVEPVLPVWSLGAYRGRRRSAILVWKNAIDDELTRIVREAMRIRVRAACPSWIAARGTVAVVPAPSRWRRRHDGRFVAGHLAAAVACGLAEAGVPTVVRDALRSGRVRASASIREREAKSRGIKAASVEEDVCILVDDVLTTGATLAACVRSLRSVGVSPLGAYVLAAAENPRKLSATM